MTTERSPRDRRTRDLGFVNRMTPPHDVERVGERRQGEKRKANNGLAWYRRPKKPYGRLANDRSGSDRRARHPEAALVAVGEREGGTAPSGGSEGGGVVQAALRRYLRAIHARYMGEGYDDSEHAAASKDLDRLILWAESNADRWEAFSDMAEAERGSNGDNSLVRYVGPWAASFATDDGNGCNETPTEWIDEYLRQNPTPPREPAPAAGTLVERLADGWPIPLSEKEAYRLAKFALRTVADEMHAKGEHQVVHILRTEADR